jgi:hypothetical protein
MARHPQGSLEQLAFARHSRAGGDPWTLLFKHLTRMDEQNSSVETRPERQ